MKLLFDIETNGLPRQGLDHIHCIVVKDIDTEEVFRFNDTGNSDSITNAITLLQEADVLIGHNIVGVFATACTSKNKNNSTTTSITTTTTTINHQQQQQQHH